MSEAIDRLEACLRAGVREFVLCGGARNAPLIEALVAREDVLLWRHFEERGAAFFALGRTMSTGEPCAVVVTSGTAVAECLPAVVEAFYQGRPLVVISADRPERFRGSGAPQVIEQEAIFSSYAWRGEGWDGAGPWHVNVPLEEDEKVNLAGEVGEFRQPKEGFSVSALAEFLREGIFRGLIVMVGGLEEEEREEVLWFLKDLGVPVLADATSGLREKLGTLTATGGDAYFRQRPPGKVLRLGEVPVGRFWRDLEDLPKVEVLSVCRNGLPGLARESRVIKGAVGRILRGLGPVEEVGDVLDDLAALRRRLGKVDELLEACPDSEPALVRAVSMFATTGESVFLGNSLPIREWQDFAQRDLAYGELRACRGVNGIDGQVSAWLGATAAELGAWGIFGDLTALYDASAPALLSQVEQRGRVLVVINNAGGRIFERLPRLAGMDEVAREALVQPQAVDFEAWAAMWGMDYVRVAAAEDLDEFEEGEACLLMELRPDQEQTEEFWRALGSL
ncbi:MAG: thiamine pyrophosphate-binding protein [Verrucomicrobiales bacterium]